MSNTFLLPDLGEGLTESEIVTWRVAEGDAVEVGQAVATIEAMKMEATITAQAAGTVRRVVTEGVTPVNGGDLLLVIE